MGRLDYFRELPKAQQSRILETIKFKGLIENGVYTKAVHSELMTLLHSGGYRSISLRGNEYVTDSELMTLLEKNQGCITRLDITGCHQITDRTYGLFSKASIVDKLYGCERLEYLRCDEAVTNGFRPYKDRVIADVSVYGNRLKNVRAKLRNDKAVVLAAVKQNGKALQYASADLKNNKAVVLAAVKQCGEALEYASDELKKDKEIVLAAVNQDSWALQFASDDLRNNKEVVLAAVKWWGWALQFASADLRNDKKVVLAAVKQCGHAIKFASDRLRNNREIVRASLTLGLGFN